MPINIEAIARRQRPISVGELVELSRDPAKILEIEKAFNDRLTACQEAERTLRKRYPSDLATTQTALSEAVSLLREAKAAIDYLASEVSSEVERRYSATTKKYPDELRRYERDISPIRGARDLLTKITTLLATLGEK